MRLLKSEIRREIGRKGSFFGAMGWVGIWAIGVLVWAILDGDATSAVAVENGTGILLFVGVLAAIVIGATAGAYDLAQGTMRYLVLTGRPRWQLVIVRIPALLATVTLFMLPAQLLILLAAVVAGGEGTDGTAVFDLFYVVLFTSFAYALLSMAIGTFLKSTGVAIAVAIVLNFASLVIVGAVAEWVSEDLANALYPVVVLVVAARDAGSGSDATFSVASSALILAGWLVVLIGAAWARVQRSEY